MPYCGTCDLCKKNSCQIMHVKCEESVIRACPKCVSEEAKKGNFSVVTIRSFRVKPKSLQ